MNIKTPALSVRSVNVFGALFKAQLPDTLTAIRQAIPDWTAVHAILDPGPASRRAAPPPEEMRDALLRELQPLAMLLDPIYTLTTPEIPPHAFATFAPDHVRPKFAADYPNWKFVWYKEARGLLGKLFDRALGGIPEGYMGVADALCKGQIKGQAVLEGWTGSMAIPTYRRTVEALVNRAGRVMFWDASFGYESTGEKFLDMSEQLFGMLDVKNDRLYFDAAEFSWFVVFYPGGQMRVGMLG